MPRFARAQDRAEDPEIGEVQYPTYEGASGLRSDGQREPLYPRTAVYGQEKIITPQTGSTKLVFLDQTSLRIGPASDVTLDRFIYDPATSRGQVLINLTSGIMRFVTGDIATADGTVQMKTPHATITVRGTDVVIKTEEDQSEVTTTHGQVGILPAGSDEEVVGTPGTTVIIWADGSTSSSENSANANAPGVRDNDESDGPSGSGGGSGSDPADGGGGARG